MRLRNLFEAPATAVMAFGRMNPPTIGHAKLVDAIKSQPGDSFIFLSQSQKPKTDPLTFSDKLRYAKFFFPEVTIGNPEVKTIIQALQKIESLGYQQLIYVAGSDRVSSFEELINKYNGVEYNFKSIKVVSAGERDPDADGADGMSASKMRQAAVDNDLESFKQGVPQQELADEMFAAVRQGMGVRDEVPAEGIEESVEDQALKSVQKTLPKLKNAAAAGRTDKVMQYMVSATKKLSSLNMGDKLLDMFTMWATQIKKGIDTGVYPAEQLPQMQKAYDSIMSKMPELQQKNAVAKAKMAKHNSKVDDKGNYKGTNITPTTQQLDRMESMKPGEAMPKQIKVTQMPTPPQAPTGPDGTDENGTQTGTTQKGNRTVSNGAGRYAFNPKGQLIQYVTPKIGGLQQTHNIAKKTITVNFGTTIDGAGIDQKATYDMSGKLISGDNTSIRSGNMGISVDKDKGSTVDYKTATMGNIKANTKTGVEVN